MVIVLPLHPKHPSPYTYDRAFLTPNTFVSPGAVETETAEAQQNQGNKVLGLSPNCMGMMPHSRLFLDKSKIKYCVLIALEVSSKRVCLLPRGGKA